MNSKLRADRCSWFLSSRGSLQQLQQIYDHTTYGCAGFNSGDGKIIPNWLGPLVGKSYYTQEVLKICNTLASSVIFLLYHDWNRFLF